MSISAVVLTKNEERNIKACLDSLSFCDEVIVIDDESSDQTLDIAKRHGANVFTRLINGDFSAQRNYALEKAKGEWVLFVDADERVSKTLKKEIKKAVSSLFGFSGYYIVRRDILWGRELRHGEVGNAKFIRLAKRNAGVWIGKIHERWNVHGKISSLNGLLRHFPHQSITEFLNDINYYTNIRAKELSIQGIQIYWASIIFYPLGKFFINYVFRLGFLDGISGFIVAMMMSLHSFLVRGKLWLLRHS